MDAAAVATNQNHQNHQPAGPVDLEALKGRQRAAWSSGNYALIGTTLLITSSTGNLPDSR